MAKIYRYKNPFVMTDSNGCREILYQKLSNNTIRIVKDYNFPLIYCKGQIWNFQMEGEKVSSEILVSFKVHSKRLKNHELVILRLENVITQEEYDEAISI